MQEFQNNYIKDKHGDQAGILLTDTDSLMHKIETENVCEDLHIDKQLFDFSNYPKGSKYFNGASNLAVGKMKDEISGVPMKKVLGLNSKMHFHKRRQSRI